MRLFSLGILCICSAFFAAGELAILRLRPSRVERLVEEENSGALAIYRLQRRLRRTLMISQLGIAISLIAIGWLSSDLTSQWWSNQEKFGRFWDVSFFVIVVLFGTLLAGLLPKALVLNRPEKSALKLAPVLEAVIVFLGPLLSLLEKFASILLKIFGLNTQWDSLVSAFSADELETIIESGRVTDLRPDEKNILEGAFALRDTQLREIMIPRSGMVTLASDVRFSQLMREVHRTKHARFIVTKDSLDDVLGFLDIRHLAEPISKGEMEPSTLLQRYIEPIPRVLETLTLEELLPLIKNGNPFLLVVDEHGGTEGLITTADLTGEIVGEEIDSEKKGPFLKQINNSHNWLAAGDSEIVDLNRQLNLGLPEGINHHTLAGFLLEEMQQIPSVGENLRYKSIRFEIISMEGPRIHRVRINLTQKTST